MNIVILSEVSDTSSGIYDTISENFDISSISSEKKYCGCDQSFVTSFAVFSLYQKFLIHYQKFMIFYQKILIFHQKNPIVVVISFL